MSESLALVVSSAIIATGLFQSVLRYCEMREYIHIHSKNYKP
jgi:hypothetical protein